MALKEEELKEQSRSPKSSLAKWKRRGIIGAAAVTGGTLLAVTGGRTFQTFLCFLTQVLTCLSKHLRKQISLSLRQALQKTDVFSL